jgi:hypothetical protein
VSITVSGLSARVRLDASLSTLLSGPWLTNSGKSTVSSGCQLAGEGNGCVNWTV